MSYTTQATGNAGWRDALQSLRSQSANRQILGGSLLMLVGSGLVSIINFGYNVAVARLLGPSAFGHAAAALTLLMLLSAINLAYQLVAAKFIARNESIASKAAVYQTLRRKSWVAGLGLGTALALLSAPVSTYLNLPNPAVVTVLAAGIAFYIPLGVKRGALQGMCQFSRLTVNFILETLVKLVGAIVLIELGMGVMGAVAAITASVVVAYFFPPVSRELLGRTQATAAASFREGMQATVFFIGQVIINNIDILLVKHFFEAGVAGQYAAVALVGRVVYLLSWSVVSAMFPISAGADEGEDDPSLLIVPISLVLGIALAFTAVLGLFPELVLTSVFGPAYHDHPEIAALLMLNATGAGIYSLAVVLMAYEISRRIANTGWIQLAFSGGIILSVYAFHDTLREVLVVQLVLRVALLIAVAMPFFRAQRRQASARTAERAAVQPSAVLAISPDGTPVPSAVTEIAATPVRKLRQIPEADIIAAFLQNEFYHAEFDRDRDQFRSIVAQPDTTNDVENALRRALLFRRRDTMWHELPADTEWWEVELTSEHLDRISMFPRAQWRTLADGNFMLGAIVEKVRTNRYTGRTRIFIQKLLALSSYLRRNPDHSTVLLIAPDEYSRMTVIEGNHRLTAAMVAGPEIALKRFRYVCGFSSHMNDCCWYSTNMPNLARYAVKRARLRLFYDHEGEIARLHAMLRRRSENMLGEPAARKTA